MREQTDVTLLRSTDSHKHLMRVLVATDIGVLPATNRVHDLPQSGMQDQPTLLMIDAGEHPNRAIGQIKRIKEQYPGARIAILADHYRRSDLVSAYQAGVNVCLARDMTCGAFMKALDLITQGETILPPELLPFICDQEDHHEPPPPALSMNEALGGNEDAFSPIGLDAIPRLSAREKCILRCIVDGDSNKAIARKINIAEATVKVHVKAILRKVRLSNRTQAAIWALNNNSFVWSADADLPPVGTLVVPPPLAPDSRGAASRSPPAMKLHDAADATAVGAGAVMRRSIGRKFE